MRSCTSDAVSTFLRWAVAMFSSTIENAVQIFYVYFVIKHCNYWNSYGSNRTQNHCNVWIYIRVWRACFQEYIENQFTIFIQIELLPEWFTRLQARHWLYKWYYISDMDNISYYVPALEYSFIFSFFILCFFSTLISAHLGLSVYLQRSTSFLSSFQLLFMFLLSFVSISIALSMNLPRLTAYYPSAIDKKSH